MCGAPATEAVLKGDPVGVAVDVMRAFQAVFARDAITAPPDVDVGTVSTANSSEG